MTSLLNKPHNSGIGREYIHVWTNQATMSLFPSLLISSSHMDWLQPLFMMILSCKAYLKKLIYDKCSQQPHHPRQFIYQHRSSLFYTCFAASFNTFLIQQKQWRKKIQQDQSNPMCSPDGSEPPRFCTFLSYIVIVKTMQDKTEREKRFWFENGRRWEGNTNWYKKKL